MGTLHDRHRAWTTLVQPALLGRDELGVRQAEGDAVRGPGTGGEGHEEAACEDVRQHALHLARSVEDMKTHGMRTTTCADYCA